MNLKSVGDELSSISSLPLAELAPAADGWFCGVGFYS